MKLKKNSSRVKRHARFFTLSLGFTFFGVLTLSGCQTPQPRQINDICRIFNQYPKWYWATQASEQRWGVPIAVQMSIIHQESSFKGNSKPARSKLLWVIPWKRPSSAVGYSQALKGTWEHYQQKTGQNGAKRSAFSDAADFIGWYAEQANKQAGIIKHHAKQLYLAYHEGIGGYQRKTYASKPQLMHTATKVELRARQYQQQLQRCEGTLPVKPWWRKIF